MTARTGNWLRVIGVMMSERIVGFCRFSFWGRSDWGVYAGTKPGTAAEEKALTDERPGMDAVTFRDKASAFDAKVRRIRAEQEAKAVKLAEENGNAQRQFFAVAQPVLQELMIESGASVMLDRRSLLLSTDAVDVTDTATRRIDAAIGDGARIVDPQPAPQPAPQPQEPEQK